VFLSTGGINKSFDVLDTVMVMDSQKAGILSPVELGTAFEGVKAKLKEAARALGGDAVLFCQFEHRAAHSGGLMPTLVIEFFAYGTVVKLGE
jgi:hypothetical protein